MTKFLIGAGGWAYFQVPGLNSLDAYARAFNFVEVNSTFYEIPSLSLVKAWRQRVPLDFEFSVKCHSNVTHRYQLEPLNEVLNTFETMLKICRILNSKFLVLETPPSMDFSQTKIKTIKNLFGSMKLEEIRIVLEIRSRQDQPLPPDLIALMQDYNLIHCVDLSKEEPATSSDISYTRIFGKGEQNIYQFTDEELLEVDNRIQIRNPKTAVVSFHNVRMYKDAARFKVYKQTNRFQPVTRARGQQSLKEVLTEDAEFPATKEELVKSQGWKVIDLADNRRVHAYTLLEKLPSKQFNNVDEVLAGLPQA